MLSQKKHHMRIRKIHYHKSNHPELARKGTEGNSTGRSRPEAKTETVKVPESETGAKLGEGWTRTVVLGVWKARMFEYHPAVLRLREL